MDQAREVSCWYRIDLTTKEVRTLAWLTDRGYWPKEAYDKMFLDPQRDNSWLIPEHAAWSIRMLEEEDPVGFLTCCGEPLLSKLMEVRNRIV